jgi:GNAT superfamily N-acetyltransferase
MHVAGLPVDDPSVPPMGLSQFRGWWASGFSGNPMQAWLATDDSGEPVGGYALELPVRENRANAFPFVLVSPSRRRQGIGTALLIHAAGVAGGAGRSLLMSGTRMGAPGDAFAEAAGSRNCMLEARRRLGIDAGLRARLAGLRAQCAPHAAGYTLRSWRERTPPEFLDGVSAVFTALGDAPHEDSFEPEGWDVERLRAFEDTIAERGSRLYTVAAVSAAGELAALTQVEVDPGQPQWGWQEITAVLRQHRGHRLGLLIKVEMLAVLASAEPQLRQMATYNSMENEHMVAINDALGYQITDHFRTWELDVTAAIALSRAASVEA